MIIPERVLVQVPLKVLCGNDVVYAANPPLHERPEAFDGVCVDIPTHVHLRCVVNAVMEVARLPKSAIRLPFVGVHDGAGHDVLSDQRYEGLSLRVGNLLGDHATLALNHSENGCFAGAGAGATRPPVAALAADVRLIGFDCAAEHCPVIFEKLPDLVKHPPSCFVGDADLPLKLLRGNTAASGRDQKDGVEPKTQGRARVLKDGARHRVFMVSAAVARVRRTALDAMVLCHRLADLTVNAFRVQEVAEPIKARPIRGKVPLEVANRVIALRRGLVFHHAHLPSRDRLA